METIEAKEIYLLALHINGSFYIGKTLLSRIIESFRLTSMFFGVFNPLFSFEQ